jgi:hypothetical protein
MTDLKANLPKEKQTPLGLYVAAKEAYEMWKTAPADCASATIFAPFMKTCVPPEKPSSRMKKRRWYLPLLVATLTAPLWSAQGQSPAASPSEPQAMPILKSMSEFLAQAEHFSVVVREGYDVVQESGQKLEFGEVRKITVSRPDHLRIEVERSNGEKGLVIFDGKDLAVYLANQNVYAISPRPGSLDEAIKYVVGDLKVQVPLAMMLLSTLPSELDNRVASAEYVEKTTITDVPCDHLAVRTDSGVDFQVWIAQGDKPLPRRIVITYKDETGQPQFWADLSDWNLAPEMSDALFAFTPPNGAERIQFLAEIHNLANKANSKTKKVGQK